MTDETVLTALIKDAEPFDHSLLLALHALRSKQGSLSVHTSRFALLRALRLEYSDDNVKRLAGALRRLTEKPLFVPGPESGFALATKAIARFEQERDSEKLVVSLGEAVFLMKIAVISDIHGNLEAFKAILADMGNAQIEDIVCLGDNVGYGPEPEEVVRLIRQRHISCVLGNHEQALTQPRFLKRMNPSAQKSTVITKDLLSFKAIEHFTTLQPAMIFQGALCVHGCPPDSVTTYLFTVFETRLKRLFRAMDERICFAGHTHDLEIISFDGNKVSRNTLGRGLVDLDNTTQYIINAGSVGQPRDGNNNAKYLIWDTVSATIEVRFVPYDIAKTAGKILELGFPEFNATRLW